MRRDSALYAVVEIAEADGVAISEVAARGPLDLHYRLAKRILDFERNEAKK
jgi:hypothetical protein